MFHKTSTRLTAIYLAIMMGVSLFFSVNLYQLSVQEFDRGFRGQGAILRHGPDINDFPILREQIIKEQEARYNEAKRRVLSRLAAINLVILIGGGVASYYLARRTLNPIEHAHRALERFTADASHELRTPIAAMQSEIEVALMDPKITLAQAKSQLKSNLEELAKLTALSEGLLHLAQTDRQGAPLVPLEVGPVVSQALKQVAPIAKKKGIIINHSLIDGLKVMGNPISLEEAIVTIVDNAIKYSPPKSEIKVKAAKDLHLAHIHITDQGIGIKPEELPQIFERFYRADSSRSKQRVVGYGLGLAIAKNIIEQHGGRIRVKSQPGAGSSFTISIPLAK